MYRVFMDSYSGTPEQIALERKVHAEGAWIAATPGACDAVRMFGTDDPDMLGWDVIERVLARDGCFGFRLVPAGRKAEVSAWLGERGYRLDTWDVFHAGCDAILPALASLDLMLPAGFTQPGGAEVRTEETVREAQAFMAGNGVKPMGGPVLSGLAGPASLAIIRSPDGAIAATAFGYFPHNRASGHHRSAWGGLVAVAPQHRGKRLGVLANALMARAMIEDHGAEAVYELVSASNEPSRRMIGRCGLVHDPALFSGIAVAEDAGKFTR